MNVVITWIICKFKNKDLDLANISLFMLFEHLQHKTFLDDTC